VIRPTPLQQQLQALADLVGDSRDLLDARGYAAFVEIACDIIGREAARLLFAELEPDNDEETAA
jgi:hypothetical protein